MAYEEPTLDVVGGDDSDGPVATLGLAIYFVFFAAVIYVAAVFSVGVAAVVATVEVGLPND